MSSKYQDLFNKLDTDGDGFITAEELQSGLSELNFPVEADQVNEFIQKIDINGDGLISLYEFQTFADSKNPEHQDSIKVFEALTESMRFCKRISVMDSTIMDNQGDRTSVSFVAKTKGVEDFESLTSKIAIRGSFCSSLTEEKVGDLGLNTAVYLYFKCQNPESVAESLRQNVSDLKDFLLEVDQSLTVFVKDIEFPVKSLDDGVAVVVDLSKSEIIQPYLQIASSTIGNFVCLDPKLNIEIGSSKSIADENFLGGYDYVSVNGNIKNLVQAYLESGTTPLGKDMEEELKSAIKQKMGIEVSLFLSLLNVDSLDVTLQLNHVDESKIDMKLNLNEQMKNGVNLFKETPFAAILKSMEFLKEAVQTLQSNEVSEVSVGVFNENVNLRADLKLDLSYLFEKLFEEDD